MHYFCKCECLYHEEPPYVLLSVRGGAHDLAVAVVGEGSGLQSGLQLSRALEELRLCGHLAHVHLSLDRLRRLLLRSHFRVLKRHQLPSELEETHVSRDSQDIHNRFFKVSGILTAKDAPTGLRTHLGGFFRGGMMVVSTVG